MHLTDGKIDLTRNHEALRVFHDLKPDIRATNNGRNLEYTSPSESQRCRSKQKCTETRLQKQLQYDSSAIPLNRRLVLKLTKGETARTQTQSDSDSTIVSLTVPIGSKLTKKIALQALKGELSFVFCAALRSKSKKLGREG